MVAPQNLPSSKLESYRQNCSAVRGGRNDRDGSVQTRDPMHLFSFAFLIERNRAKDRRQDHPRTMNPREGFVNSDFSTNLSSRNSRGADGVISAQEIQVPRHRTEGKM